MTSQQIALVKSTWTQVLPISDTAASLFYNRLFVLNPNLQALFKGDITVQGKKLIGMIGTAVNSLDHLHRIVPAVQDLGRRHAAYGVKDQDYDTVAAALIWTLGQGLDEAFTEEVKNAWIAAYGILATTMKQAATE